MSGETVLLIDDEPNILKLLARRLRKEGYSVLTANNGENGLELLRKESIDLIVTDMRMPGIDGLEVVRRVREWSGDIQLIIMTAYGTIKSAVEAMRLGAYYYIVKPFELAEIVLLIRNALKLKHLEIENRYLKQEIASKLEYNNIIGESSSIQKLRDIISRITQTSSTVLITGETGTGKELVAYAIHYNSPEKDETFMKINCAAIPETLLESELFGYIRGAFTGATHNRKGAFLMCNGGSIFLDEIAALPHPIQAKLLRVLQEQEFQPLGSDKSIKVNVRIIAATNKDLHKAVKCGEFRDDLYYRLNVIPIVLSPLRERRMDIPLLIKHLIKKIIEKIHCSIKGITPEAIILLQNYPWPGNVRELENSLERAMVLCHSNRLYTDDFYFLNPPNSSVEIISNINTLNLKENIQILEKTLVKEALKQANGIKKDAAGLLGISQRSMSYYLQKYEI